MPKVDSRSRKLILGVASLICDYFENTEELNNYLQLFFKEKDLNEDELLDTSK
jgi:hypothetical protein